MKYIIYSINLIKEILLIFYVRPEEVLFSWPT